MSSFVDFFSVSDEYLRCEIVAIPEKYYSVPFPWAFPKNSPYLDIFNFYITELIESGQWNAILKRYQPSSPNCPDLNGKPIEFNNCISAFIVLIFGLLTALLTLFFEKANILIFGIPDATFKVNFNQRNVSKEDLTRILETQQLKIDSLKIELKALRLKEIQFLYHQSD